MRKFVVVVGILSIIASVILALVFFVFALMAHNRYNEATGTYIVLGIALLFNAVYQGFFLAWLCSIDDTANNARRIAYEKLSSQTNEIRDGYKKSLVEIEKLKAEISSLTKHISEMEEANMKQSDSKKKD